MKLPEAVQSTLLVLGILAILPAMIGVVCMGVLHWRDPDPSSRYREKDPAADAWSVRV